MSAQVIEIGSLPGNVARATVQDMIGVPPTIPRGLFRTGTGQDKRAAVLFSTRCSFLTKHEYWRADYLPSFVKLPTQEEYEAQIPPNETQPSGQDLRSHLKIAEARLREAEQLVKSQKNGLADRRSWNSDDRLLAEANLGVFERRVELRLQELNELKKFFNETRERDKAGLDRPQHHSVTQGTSSDAGWAEKENEQPRQAMQKAKPMGVGANSSALPEGTRQPDSLQNKHPLDKSKRASLWTKLMKTLRIQGWHR